MSLVADTGGLYARYDSDDAHHATASSIVQNETGPIIVPMAILGELDYLLRALRSVDAELDFGLELDAKPGILGGVILLQLGEERAHFGGRGFHFDAVPESPDEPRRMTATVVALLLLQPKRYPRVDPVSKPGPFRHDAHDRVDRSRHVPIALPFHRDRGAHDAGVAAEARGSSSHAPKRSQAARPLRHPTGRARARSPRRRR